MKLSLAVQGEGQQLASNQVQYSLLYRVPETNGVKDALQESGSTLIAYSPLCQGLLTGESKRREEGKEEISIVKE